MLYFRNTYLLLLMPALFFFISGPSIEASRAEEQEKVLDNLGEDLNQIKGELKGDLETGADQVESRRKAAMKLDRKLRKAEQELKGPKRAVAAAVRKYSNLLQKKSSKYNTVYKEITARNSFSPELASSISELEAHRRLMLKFSDENKNLLNLSKNSETLFTEILKESNLSQKDYDEALAAYRSRRKRNLPLQIKIREADAKLAEINIARINLLKKHWGSWIIDSKSQTVQLEDAAAAKEFERLTNELIKTSEQQEYAQLKMLRK